MSVFENAVNLSSFRSCRDEDLPREVVGRILEAGRKTPSPSGIESLEFIVVESDSKLEALSRITDDDRIAEAPTSIIVLADVERMGRNVGSDKAEKFCSAECAASIQNMRLVAEEQGVASCWINGFDEQAVADEFNIPHQKVPEGVVVLGYSDDRVPMDSRFNLENICYYDQYDNQLRSVFDKMDWKGIRREKRIYGKKASGFLGRIRRRLKEVL